MRKTVAARTGWRPTSPSVDGCCGSIRSPDPLPERRGAPTRHPHPVAAEYRAERSGTGPPCRVLRQALVESARGAVFKRDSYLAAQYRRLVKRCRDKQAIVAVAHSILVIAYHVLRDGQSYRELGSDYFDHLNAQRLIRYNTQRLAALSYVVTPHEIRRMRPPLAPFT